MKLTNALREQFLDDVMKAIPWKNTMTDELAMAEMEKRAFAALPADVKAMHKKYPGVLATANKSFKGMPDRFIDDAHRAMCRNYGRYWGVTVPNIVDVTKIDIEDLRVAVEKRDDEYVKRRDMRAQLRGVAYHATTVEELEKALPELKKWIPKPVSKEKTMALAPVGLVANLKKAGLPVGRKGVAA